MWRPSLKLAKMDIRWHQVVHHNRDIVWPSIMQDTEVTFIHIKRELSIKHLNRLNIFKIHKIYTVILKIDCLGFNQIMKIMPPKTVKYADGGHFEKGKIVSLGTFFTGDIWIVKIYILVVVKPILPTGRKCKNVTTSVCSQVFHTISTI